MTIRQPLHQTLYHPVCRRAILDVLLVHVHIIRIHLLMMMRETRAVARPDLIDIAKVRFQVQELTRLLYIHPIPRLILIQPLLTKRFFRHPQMR